MNKKEMVALADIISEMKYSNNSVPEVMDYADRLLHMFPKLKGNSVMPQQIYPFIKGCVDVLDNIAQS